MSDTVHLKIKFYTSPLYPVMILALCAMFSYYLFPLYFVSAPAKMDFEVTLFLFLLGFYTSWSPIMRNRGVKHTSHTMETEQARALLEQPVPIYSRGENPALSSRGQRSQCQRSNQATSTTWWWRPKIYKPMVSDDIHMIHTKCTMIYRTMVSDDIHMIHTKCIMIYRPTVSDDIHMIHTKCIMICRPMVSDDKLQQCCRIHIKCTIISNPRWVILY